MGWRENFKFFLDWHGFVASLFLLAVLALNANAIRWVSSTSSKRSSFNSGYPLTPGFVKWVTAGYWPAAADYLWIDGISEIGKNRYTEENFRRSYEVYDLGTKLDPDFYELYEQAGVLFSFFYENADASLEFLNRGIRRYESGVVPRGYWTHPVTLYIHRAYVWAYQKNDWHRARQAYLAAAEVPNGPAYLQRMKVWMKTEKSERILAIRVLERLIYATSDEKIRSKYEDKLRSYGK
jgi:hypothetical protein